MTTEKISNAEFAKEFLLCELKYLQESFWKNEAAGETRVNYFITLVTAVLAGLVALLTSILANNSTASPTELPDHIYPIIGWVLSGLLLLGVVTLQRIMKRNTVTDGYKKDMDRIRERFRDYFDDNGVLDDYNPFGPSPIPPGLMKAENSSKRIGNDLMAQSISKSIRKPGGLAYLVLIMNTILLFASVKVFVRDIPLSAWIFITIGFILLQMLWIVMMESRSHKALKENEITHAGGIVFREYEDGLKFLLTTALHNRSEWVFPKGHLEDRESHKQAAVREVLEETGVNAIPVRPLGVIGFEVNSGSERVICKYYLMRYIAAANISSAEKRAIKWVTYTEACGMIRLPEAHRLLQEAQFRAENICRRAK